MGKFSILNHTDGVMIPGLCHGSYLCVGVISGVILQDSVDSTCSVTACKRWESVLAYFPSRSNVNTKYKDLVIYGSCSQASHGTGEC